jgi:hypothetical protein
LFAAAVSRWVTPGVPRLRRIAAANPHPRPALSKMGYALKALHGGLETCITSPL